MKDNLKLLLKYIMRFVLKVFWVFPIRKKTVFFMANMGKGMLCNPKYIYSSMVNDDRFKDYAFIWCFIDPDKYPKDLFSNNTVIIRKRNLISYFYSLLTSQIIIYNCGGFSYAPIRKEQFLIETLHAGGVFKCVGHTIADKSKASKKGISLANKDIKLYLSSCEISNDYIINQSFDYHGEIIHSGFPRNDFLFHHDRSKVNSIKESLGVPIKSKIVLYAPTFKGLEDRAVNHFSDIEIIDPQLIKKALHDRFGGDWLFFTRGHQYVKGLEVSGSDGDVSRYEDMQELLIATDVLITDYSSSPWDYSILNRPIFLYAPDLIQYKKKDRGFLLPIEQWPGILACTNYDLVSRIESYDQDAFEKTLSDYHIMAGTYEHGDACEKVKQRILDYIESDEATAGVNQS